MIAEFEKRYPPIKVKLNRAGSEKLLTRVLAEARAKRFPPTSFKPSNSACISSKRSGVLARYMAPGDSPLPKEF